MTDNTELKRAAERIVEVQTSQDVPVGILFDEFEALASPEAILALIAESERLVAWREGLLKERAAHIRQRDQLKAENDRLNAENKQLILLECYGGTAQAAINLLAECDQLKAEIEALRKDAERYRRMRSAALKQADVLADEFDAEFDLQLDAALGKEVQS